MEISEKKKVVDEIELLTKKRDQLKIDIENMRNVVNQETETKIMGARRLASEVEERRKKLDTDKADLEKMAVQLKNERASLEKEKESVNAYREEAKRQTERVGSFILLVRREAEKL